MTAADDEQAPEQTTAADSEQSGEAAAAATSGDVARPAGAATPEADADAPSAAKPKPDQPKPAKPASKAAPEEDEDEPPPPEPTPETCYGVVIGQAALERAILDGEFDDSELMFYLEPAGVMNADLICTRSYPAESVRGGILMTRAAREAKKVFFSDNVNPDSYELSFPKEFGYVKSVKHYMPETYEHAKYPFSKKY